MPVPHRSPVIVAPDAVPNDVLEAVTRMGSPVHELQAAIDEAWRPAPAAALRIDAKHLCPGRLALIGALGLASWVPVVAAASAIVR